MIPQIFSLGPIPLNSFGLCIALAILAAIYILAESFKRNGIDSELAEKYAVTAGLSGVLGARIWYLFENYNSIKHDFWSAAFSSAGFTFYGGFIFSTIILIVMSRRDKLPLSNFADSLGPSLTIGYGIGRLGCQLSGDGDYGIVTQSILGMSFSSGVIPTPPGVLVYPTPLYESAICFIILWLLFKAEKSTFFEMPFRRFALYLGLLGMERFSIEFLRINPKIAAALLSEAQVIALILMIISLFLFLRGSRKFA